MLIFKTLMYKFSNICNIKYLHVSDEIMQINNFFYPLYENVNTYMTKGSTKTSFIQKTKTNHTQRH